MTDLHPLDEIETLDSLEGMQLMIRDKLRARVGDAADGCAEDVVRLLQAMGLRVWTTEQIRTCKELDAGMPRRSGGEGNTP